MHQAIKSHNLYIRHISESVSSFQISRDYCDISSVSRKPVSNLIKSQKGQ